ncbi:MAG: hypothetical protein KIT17_17025 [Rubrivivax sp.]|nr:hypothetical protein [Rubrivivax sp.]
MNLLATALGLARFALPVGLVLLAMALWLTLRSGAAGPGVPGERELPVVGGLVTGVREVAVPAADPGAPARKAIELDLQTEAGGTPMKLRIDAAIATERVTAALNRRATVRYDPADGNRLYVLTADDAEIVSHADIARRLRQEREQTQAAARPPATLWAAGAALGVIGTVGIAWRRRLQAPRAAA